MKKIILFVIMVLLAFNVGAQEKPLMAGAWYNDNTETMYILFPDGSMLFTFLHPPVDIPIENWHTNGTWKMIDSAVLEIKYSYTEREKTPFFERIDKFRLLNGKFFSKEGTFYSKLK